MEKDSGSKSTSVFIGRENELKLIEVLLEMQKTMLIVVSGIARIGKRSFLNQIEKRAIKLGWASVQKNEHMSLSVKSDTTKDIFLDFLVEQLDYQNFDQPSLVENNPTSSLIASPQKEHLRDFRFKDISTERKLRAILHPELSTQERRGAQTTFDDPPEHQGHYNKGQTEIKPQIKEHIHIRPLLLLVSGYRPSPSFAKWFLERFLEDVKNGLRPVVVIISDLPFNVSKLCEIAPKRWNNDLFLRIPLGPLAEQPVRDYFEDISNTIRPTLDRAEMETYVEASKNDPRLLGYMKSLLQLKQALPNL